MVEALSSGTFTDLEAALFFQIVTVAGRTP
jgi:hypothetical protein